MAGKAATLPTGVRLADYLSTGLLARICTPDEVAAALKATGRQSIRQRDLPAHAVAYYVMALSLYRGVNYQEVLRVTVPTLPMRTWNSRRSNAARVVRRCLSTASRVDPF